LLGYDLDFVDGLANQTIRGTKTWIGQRDQARQQGHYNNDDRLRLRRALPCWLVVELVFDISKSNMPTGTVPRQAERGVLAENVCFLSINGGSLSLESKA